MAEPQTAGAQIEQAVLISRWMIVLAFPPVSVRNRNTREILRAVTCIVP